MNNLILTLALLPTIVVTVAAETDWKNPYSTSRSAIATTSRKLSSVLAFTPSSRHRCKRAKWSSPFPRHQLQHHSPRRFHREHHHDHRLQLHKQEVSQVNLQQHQERRNQKRRQQPLVSIAFVDDANTSKTVPTKNNSTFTDTIFVATIDDDSSDDDGDDGKSKARSCRSMKEAKNRMRQAPNL